jgi:hypothetical protein
LHQVIIAETQDQGAELGSVAKNKSWEDFSSQDTLENGMFA